MNNVWCAIKFLLTVFILLCDNVNVNVTILFSLKHHNFNCIQFKTSHAYVDFEIIYNWKLWHLIVENNYAFCACTIAYTLWHGINQYTTVALVYSYSYSIRKYSIITLTYMTLMISPAVGYTVPQTNVWWLDLRKGQVCQICKYTLYLNQMIAQ